MSALAQTTLGTFLHELSAKSPTPGGGAVSGVVGALGAALGTMAIAYTQGTKRASEAEPQLAEASEQLARARAALIELAEEDQLAYGALNDAMRRPKDDPERAEAVGRCAHAAASAPLAALGVCARVLDLLAPLAPVVNRHLLSDLRISAMLTETAARASAINVRVNLPLIPDGAIRGRIEAETVSLLTKCADRAGAIEAANAT